MTLSFGCLRFPIDTATSRWKTTSHYITYIFASIRLFTSIFTSCVEDDTWISVKNPDDAQPLEEGMLRNKFLQKIQTTAPGSRMKWQVARDFLSWILNRWAHFSTSQDEILWCISTAVAMTGTWWNTVLAITRLWNFFWGEK